MPRANAAAPQTTLLVRGLPPAVKQRLRLRAAQHGRSLEAEARDLLIRAADLPPQEEPGAWVRELRAHAAAVGGWDDVRLPRRSRAWSPPKL